MKRRLPLYLVLALALSGCKALPSASDLLSNIPFLKGSEHQQGESAYASGDYDRAVPLLQQAADKKPDDQAIKKLLAKAQIKAAAMHAASADQASKASNPRLVIKELEKAISYTDTDAYRQRLALAQEHFSRISIQVDAAVSALKAPSDWEAAITQGESLLVYQSSFPSLQTALLQARQQGGESLGTQANNWLAQGQLGNAVNTIRRAVKLSKDAALDAQYQAFNNLDLAQQRVQANDLRGALAAVASAKQLQPGNPAVIQYHAAFVDEMSGQLYNDAQRASRSGRYDEAIQRLETLQQVNPDFADTGSLMEQNRLRLSENHRLQAEQLAESGGAEAAGQVLIHYLLAQRSDPRSYALQDAVLQARKALSNEIELRVSIDFENQSREPGAGAYVRDRVLDGVRNSMLRNVTVLEREAIDDILREQGLGQGFMEQSTAVQVKKIRGIQTGVKGTVTQVSVRESGRDRPSYGSVRYESGSRYVPNPAYRDSQANLTVAQQNVYSAQQALNRARANRQTKTATYNPSGTTINNQLSLLGQVIADSEVATAEKSLNRAQSNLNQYQYELTSTPSQIEEPVFANARYPIYNLRLDGEVKISFRMIDFTTSEVGRSHSVHAKDTVSDQYIAGDPGKGIADDPDDLPPLQVFKEQLLNRAVKETIEKLNAEFLNHSQRFLVKARRAKKQGIGDEAVENYFRFLAAVAGDSGEGVIEAQTYLKDHFGTEIKP